jgi:death-on-curing family protein
LPRSKVVYGLKADYIEFIHDTGIAIMWPGLEPVHPHDCLDQNLLASAAVQPFQGGFGREFYPTISDKAACLFFSLAGGHIFSNGNKRTAVVAVDQFLHANSIYLVLSNNEVKKLAEDTASYHERNETQEFAMNRIAAAIAKNIIEFRMLRHADMRFYRQMLRIKNGMVKHGCVTAFTS